MFRHYNSISDDLDVWPAYPENYANLNQEEQDEITNLVRSETLHKYYLAVTKNRNPRHWAALKSQAQARREPVRIVQSVWEDRDVFFLRRALNEIVNRWDDLCPSYGLCPVSFSDQEKDLYRHEEENMGYVSDVLTIFRKNWGLSPNGSIEPGRFDEMQIELAQMKDAFVNAADTEEDRLLAEKLWPYQDTPTL